jgi:hypothetical protein
VLCRGEDYLGLGSQFDFLPPIELLDMFDSGGFKKGLIAERHEYSWRKTFTQPFQGVEIRMVVVVMAHDHEIDSRQLLERDSRLAVPVWGQSSSGGLHVRTRWDPSGCCSLPVE